MVLGVAGHHMVHAAQHVEKELILNRGFVTIHPRVKVVDHAKEMRGILKNALFSFVLLMVTGDNGVFGFPVHIPVVEDPVEGHVSVTRPSLSMGVNIVKDEIYRLITVTQNPAQ